MNVGYKKGEKQSPVTIELSIGEARALVEILNPAAASPPGSECQDAATTLLTTLREICTYAEEDLHYEK